MSDIKTFISHRSYFKASHGTISLERCYAITVSKSEIDHQHHHHHHYQHLITTIINITIMNPIIVIIIITININIKVGANLGTTTTGIIAALATSGQLVAQLYHHPDNREIMQCVNFRPVYQPCSTARTLPLHNQHQVPESFKNLSKDKLFYNLDKSKVYNHFLPAGYSSFMPYQSCAGPSLWQRSLGKRCEILKKRKALYHNDTLKVG